MIIKNIINRIRFGKSRIIQGLYKLNFDELNERNADSSYGIYDITDKGILVRMGSRYVLLSEDEVFQMFIVTHTLLSDGVEYNG